MGVELEHCKYCFDVLIATLNGKGHPEPEFQDASFPLFVTWNIQTERRLQLRGCIGSFGTQDLKLGLKQYAIRSAFQDSRFQPIAMHELEDLSCSVSLLLDFEVGNDCYDWEVGEHGIIIEFNVGTNKFRGTFLPEVASDQGWDKFETLQALARKAGFVEHLSGTILSAITLLRYRSQKLSLSYDEYLVLASQ